MVIPNKIGLLLSCLALLAGLTLIPGCSKDDKSYFPLEAGYEWRYRISVSTMNGSETKKLILRSLDPREINDRRMYIHASITGLETLYRKTDRGIEQIGYITGDAAGDRLIEEYRLVLPGEIARGIDWEGSARVRTLVRKGGSGRVPGDQVLAKIPVTSTVTSTSATVDVPAGRFSSCVEVVTEGFAFYSGDRYRQRTLVEMKQTAWYAQGVGLLKMSLQETSSDEVFAKGEWILELEAYKQRTSLF